MSVLEAIILGVIQGLTEFLPVSSSGHNVIGAAILGQRTSGPEQTAVNVLLHLGSLIAILIVFRRDIFALFLPKLDWSRLFLVGYLTLPAALAGLLLKDWIESFSDSTALVITFIALLVTAIVLLLAERKQKEVVEYETLNRRNWLLAGLIGVAQAIAITPGVSRSGATIATALLLGWKRADAVRISFIIGMVAITGAGLLKAKDISSLPLGPGIAGFLSSLVFSLLGLACLRFVVKERKLKWFSLYCAIVGIGGLVWVIVSG